MAKDFYVYTVEHRCYKVRAKNRKEANTLVKQGDLSPKDSRLKIEQMGDFEIVA